MHIQTRDFVPARICNKIKIFQSFKKNVADNPMNFGQKLSTRKIFTNGIQIFTNSDLTHLRIETFYEKLLTIFKLQND